MDQARLRRCLEELRAGATSVDDVVQKLKDLAFVDLGYATVDHHRALRQGVPEVVYGEGKTKEQLTGITQELARHGGNVLLTRVDAAKAEHLRAAVPEVRYHALARVATLEQAPIAPLGTDRDVVALVSAGTADLPVAEECGETLRMLGARVERIYDVGVAGLHRLLARRPALEKAAVLVVVAGMEGALPSVVGGLVAAPVIAVPTSCGYGAALGGMTTLCAMLTSCASGVTVCNIDNGFGAAFAAARILRAREPR
jgi:NCAIR mutase (PurE)-related protein